MNNKRISLTLITLVTMVSLMFSTFGCAGEESAPPMASLELAQLRSMNEVSAELDSDMDGIKDDIEKTLGTDPYNRDTDYDGLTDYHEVFSQAGILGATRPVDDDGDHIIAALDADDHTGALGDFTSEDWDNDGIPNRTELYGYTYNPKTGELKDWWVEGENGIPTDGPYFDSKGNPIMYFKTDPTKASTDGDPYDDYMELTGVSHDHNVSMDSSVTLPGSRPVVPAYPDLAWSMAGYDVTVISTITTSENHKTENTWKNETINERTTEDKWNVKESLDVEVSAKKQGLKSSIVANQGGQVNTKHLVTKSSSGLQQDEWYQATSIDTHKAAELKIALDIKNVGSAPAYSVLPTVQMLIGDTKVGIDFTPTETQKISALSPGQEYAGAYTLGGSSYPVTVSIDQLRALQLGAPLLLNVPQWTGEVMKLDGTQWKPVGQWQPYQININAVSAKLSIDTGDGEAESYLVYATGETGSGPDVRFRDILTWTVGYQETSDGVKIKGKLLSEYRIGFDPNSYERIKEGMNDIENLMDMVVYAKSTITLKASANPNPTIKWANYNPVTRIAQAYVLDDYEIAEVRLDTSVGSFPMTYSQDSGIGIYVTNPLPDVFSYKGTEMVAATNDRQNTGTLKLEKTDVPMPWAMFRYNAQHIGFSPFVGTNAATPKPTWKYYLNTKTFTYLTPSPVIGYDGTIYIGLEDRSFYLISPEGKLQKRYVMWAESEPNYEKWNSPAIDADGRIFTTNWAGWFYRIFPNPNYQPTGQDYIVAWPMTDLERVTLAPLTIGSDGTIYVGCDDGNIYAMDSSGNIKWKLKLGGKIRSAPAIDSDGNVYVGSTDGYLYCLKANSLNWMTLMGTKAFPAEVLTSPAIGANGTIYVVPNNGVLYAIQPSDGDIAWSLELKHISWSSPAIGGDGTIYIGDNEGNLWAINPTTGKKKWKVAIGGAISSSPAIDAEGTIYVGSDDYRVYAINPADGSKKWSYKTGGMIRSSPVIGPDGTIYIVSNDGYLYALK